MDTPKVNFNNRLAPDADVQTQLSPADSLVILKQGNERFANGLKLSRDLNHQVSRTARGQYPFAAVLSCIDSRIPTEIVFDQGVGDIFSARIAGNFINDDILGSLEFACKLAGSNLFVVMGHTACGAIKGACDDAKLGNLTQMLAKLKPAVQATANDPGTERNSSNAKFVNQVAEENVRLTIEALKVRSEVLNDLYESGAIDIVGAMYDVTTGVVTFL